MADASYRHGVETSVDLARKNTLHTTSVAREKRPAEHSDPVSAHKAGYRGVSFASAQYSPGPGPPPPRLQASSVTSAPLLHGPNEAAPLPGDSPQKRLTSTPDHIQDPLLSLSHPRYGLPPRLISNFQSLGVRSIYPWQSSCLLGRGLLSGETNLIYTAPTGGGKSLVADVLLLRRVIDEPIKKAVVVLPYVALVQEKLKWLRKLVEGVSKNMEGFTAPNAEFDPRLRCRTPQSHIRVAGFFGGSKARATWADIDIAICTIEKVEMVFFCYLSSPNARTGKFSGEYCN